MSWPGSERARRLTQLAHPVDHAVKLACQQGVASRTFVIRVGTAWLPATLVPPAMRWGLTGRPSDSHRTGWDLTDSARALASQRGTDLIPSDLLVRLTVPASDG